MAYVSGDINCDNVHAVSRTPSHITGVRIHKQYTHTPRNTHTHTHPSTTNLHMGAEMAHYHWFSLSYSCGTPEVEHCNERVCTVNDMCSYTDRWGEEIERYVLY